MTTRRVLLTITISVAGALIAPAAAHADTESKQDAWVTYERDIPTSDVAQVRTIEGSRDDGDCVFTMQSSLSPGEQVLQREEIAYNPETCQSRMAVSHTPVDQRSPKDPEEYTSVRERSAAERVSGAKAQRSESSAAATATRTHAYYGSWFEDPPGLVVNEVVNGTEWSWNGSRVLDGPAPIGLYVYEWLTATWWELASDNWDNYYTSERTTSSSYAHFRNGRFCATIDTHTYYNRNTVHGYYDGLAQGQVHWRKEGGCIGLLSFHDELIRMDENSSPQ